MRLLNALIISLLLLSACSTGMDNQPDDNTNQLAQEQSKQEEEDQSEEKPEEQTETKQPAKEVEESEETEESKEVEELSETDRLLQQLPKEVDVQDWNLILVNPWKALPDDYEAELVEVDNQQRIDARIVDAWDDWKQAALEAGHHLFFASGYRTVERQRTNFNNTLQDYLNDGLSEEEALEKTKEYLTEPGHSEHHTGLALDIVDEEWIVAGNGLEPEYDTQASQQWLVDTMDDYGFILRYPKGKEDVTGIQYESWHFRYVGVENAQFMVEHDLVLEEYVDLLKMRDEAE